MSQEKIIDVFNSQLGVSPQSQPSRAIPYEKAIAFQNSLPVYSKHNYIDRLFLLLVPSREEEKPICVPPNVA